jgi:colanic acid biosynthesis protein WcaH
MEQLRGMQILDKATFKKVVENVPLVSVDLCIICDGKILLGKRKNDPLKGFYFTPGARILKNETYNDCLKRVAKSELGLIIDDIKQAELMGIWDHFYKNSIFGEGVSTHYVNLPHYIHYDKKPEIIFDDQHEMFKWFDLSKVVDGNDFHQYTKNYVLWVTSRKSQ